jgi:ABC-type nitrate/sulfonate/bicarbonate transport system substrate-binding protein
MVLKTSLTCRIKKIGVARGTSTEFYLGRFLYLNDISLENVTLVNVRPAQFADLIGNSSADAIIVPQAYLSQVEERLGGNAVIWQAQCNQNAFGVLTCRNDWIASHPETIGKVMESLIEAGKYEFSHPEESKAILQERLNYTGEYMAAIWPQQQYSLTLDMSLVTAMEDEGRWMINSNLTGVTTIPNFRKCIYTQGLEKISPEAVNIIG